MDVTNETYTQPPVQKNLFEKAKDFIDLLPISRKTFNILILLLVVGVGIPAAVYLSQKQQDIRQRASTNGSVTFLDATTNQPITETTNPNIKLQILLPDNWELQSATQSGMMLNIIPKVYAQTTTPETTISPTTLPNPTASPSAIPTFIPTSTIDASPTATPSATNVPSEVPNSPSPTPEIQQKRILQQIVIWNDNKKEERKTIVKKEDIIDALNNLIPWTLTPLEPNETSSTQTVHVQFYGTPLDGGTIILNTTATITLKQPTTTSPTTAPSATIDVLAYFISKHPDKGLAGPQGPLSQVVDGQKAYYMKWQRENPQTHVVLDPPGKSSVFEVYSWDNDNIYLKEDHSGAPVNFYTFSPGTWMKRHMAIGEKITTNNNIIQWYDPICGPTEASKSFPIEVTLEKHDSQYDLGEDLGKQDVIIVKYDSSPSNPTNGIFERFYYSKEWGWVKWEEYNKATNTVNNISIFNKIATNPLAPDLSKACSPEFKNPSSTPTTAPLGSTLNFEPQSSSSSAIAKKVGDDISLDINLDPNGENIAVGTLFIKYDPAILEGKKITMVPGGFTNILTPFKFDNGNASITMTVGTDITKAIKTNNTKIATITFKTLKETTVPTQVSIDVPKSVITSVTNPQISVLTQTPNPAFISINQTGTPVASPNPSITIIPTSTLMPTPTFTPGATIFNIKLALQGIGQNGNSTPIHPQRTFTISLYDGTGTKVGNDKTGLLAYNLDTKNYEGSIDMGQITPGTYTIKATTPKYLTKVIANIITITTGITTYTIPIIPTMIAGDLNGDNLLNVEDYNIYKNCLGKTTADCVANSDLNDDGQTDTLVPSPRFLDYRLLISNFSLQKGE